MFLVNFLQLSQVYSRLKKVQVFKVFSQLKINFKVKKMFKNNIEKNNAMLLKCIKKNCKCHKFYLYDIFSVKSKY